MNFEPSPSTNFCVNVSVNIVNDSIVEVDETLQAELSSSDPSISDLFRTAAIFITNDDCKFGIPTNSFGHHQKVTWFGVDSNTMSYWTWLSRFVYYLAAIEVFLVPLMNSEPEEGSGEILLCVEIGSGMLERDVTMFIEVEEVSGEGILT